MQLQLVLLSTAIGKVYMYKFLLRYIFIFPSFFPYNIFNKILLLQKIFDDNIFQFGLSFSFSHTRVAI